MKKQNSFVRAGAVLVVSGFAVKLLSAAYRIPLTRMLGAAAMGRYSSIVSLFMPFFSFATAGVIPCVSRFTASLPCDGTKAMARAATKLYIPFALVMTAFFLLFGRFYSGYMEDSLFFFGAVILAPAIVCGGLETVYKGITQGRMNMNITAKANLLESVSKTVFGIGGVYILKYVFGTADSDRAVAVCLLSVTFSGAVCAVYLFFAGREKNGTYYPHIPTAKQMLAMSVPISASALAVSMVGFFDTAVCLPVIKSLPYTEIVRSYSGASFMSAGEVSIYLYGIYQGMVLTLFNLVPALTGPVATACMPLLSKASAAHNEKRLEHYSHILLKVVAALCIPCSVFVFCYGGDIVQFLFGTTASQTVVAQQLLYAAMPFCPLCCFTLALNTILNACGKSDTVFKILLSAALVRCGTNLVLCGIPSVNIRAFALSAGVFYTIIFVLGILVLAKNGVQLFTAKAVLPPLVFSVAVAGVMQLWGGALFSSLPLFTGLVLKGVVFCSAYFLLLAVSGFVVDIRMGK